MPRSEDEIIERLIDDTMRNKLHWYSKDDFSYCTVRTEKTGNIIETIFRLSEIEEPMDIMFTDYGEYLIVLDVYMRKNKKPKEIFCFRIKSFQLKLVELLTAVMHVKKELPEK